MSEVALSQEVKARPYIHYQCYFFSVPDDFLKSEVGEKASEVKIYSRAEGDSLVERLQGKRGFKLTATPAVKCRSGQEGRLELTREFRYPSEYSPPEIPKKEDRQGGIFPVTPSSPSNFKSMDVGLEASFKGRKKGDGVVEFDYDLQRTDFSGFINYGSPITAPAKGLFGKPVNVVITENRIEMPVFDTKRISSQATLTHGQYLAVGKWGRGFSPELDKAIRAQIEASPNLYVLIQVELSD